MNTCICAQKPQSQLASACFIDRIFNAQNTAQNSKCQCFFFYLFINWNYKWILKKSIQPNNFSTEPSLTVYIWQADD